MQILKRKSDMAFFKLLLSGSLIFSIAMAYDTESLFAISDNMIMPRHYNIKFIPFIKQGFFYAECNITINILNPTINISFFAENLGIIDVMLINNTYNSKANKEKINKYYPTTYLYNTETHIASAHFAHELSSGHYILNINFVGIIANNVGGFRVFHINESDYLQSMIYLSATNFQPNSVRELFPCFDVFAMVTFNISIKHSGYYRALSNMPIRDEIYEMYDMQWTYFETTPIMSTCLMTVVVTNFLVVRDEKTTVQMWCRRSLKAHAKFAFDIIIRMIQYLKSEWQYIEKFPKIDYIAIPISLLENISTVSVGLVVYRESDVMFDVKSGTVWEKRKIVRLIARKVIYEWFDTGLHSPPLMNNWLSNEGLITFFGAHVIDQIFPDYRMMNSFVVQDQQEIYHLCDKNWFPNTVVYTSINQYTPLTHFVRIYHSIKTTIILRILQHTLGKEEFWDVFRTHLIESIHSPSIEHFWALMQAVFNKKFPTTVYILNDEVDYRKVIPYCITLTMIFNYTTNHRYMEVEELEANNNFFIPMSFTTQEYVDFSNFSYFFWLIYIPEDIRMKYVRQYDIFTPLKLHNFNNNEDWIILNLQTIGCYRTQYDDENWKNIAVYLNSKDYTKIHALNRAQIIADAFYFLMTNQLVLPIFKKIIRYIPQEKDDIVWYPMLRAIEYTSSFFPFQESNDIKLLLRAISFKFVENALEYSEILTNNLMQEVMKWACTMGHSKCLEKAKNALFFHLLSCDKCFNSILVWPEWKQWIFCNGMKMASNNTWYKAFNKFLNESNNEVLRFLTCSEDLDIIHNYIKLLSFNNYIEKITDIDHINSYYFIIAKYAKNDIILDYILKNFEELRPIKISVLTLITVIINYVYTDEQLDKIMYAVENGTILMYQEMFNINNNNNKYYKASKFLLNFYLNMEKKTIDVNIFISCIKFKITTRRWQIKILKDRFQAISNLK